MEGLSDEKLTAPCPRNLLDVSVTAGDGGRSTGITLASSLPSCHQQRCVDCSQDSLVSARCPFTRGTFFIEPDIRSVFPLTSCKGDSSQSESRLAGIEWVAPFAVKVQVSFLRAEILRDRNGKNAPLMASQQVRRLSLIRVGPGSMRLSGLHAEYPIPA